MDEKVMGKNVGMRRRKTGFERLIFLRPFRRCVKIEISVDCSIVKFEKKESSQIAVA